MNSSIVKNYILVWLVSLLNSYVAYFVYLYIERYFDKITLQVYGLCFS